MNRYRWVVLAAGTLAQASFAAVLIGLPAIAPALRARYGLSIGQLGIVLGAVGLGMLPALLPWGMLSDRIGERVVISAGLACAALALAAITSTTTFGALVALLVVAGVFGASVNAASGRAVMGWFGPAERGMALGIRQAAIPIGGAAAALLLPWLTEIWSVSAAFLALAAGCAGGAALGAAFIREQPVQRWLGPTSERSPVRDARMWLLSGGSLLLLVAQISVLSFVVVFLHEQRGLSAQAAAGVLAAIQVLGIGARVGAGRWSDRMGARIRPLRLVGLALAAAMALTAVLVAAPLPLLVVALVTAGTLGLAWNGLSFAAAAESAGRSRSGAAIGFQQTVLGVGTACVPILFAALVVASSWRVGFAVAAASPLAGALVLRRLRDPAPSLRPAGPARTHGTSATPPAAPRTPG